MRRRGRGTQVDEMTDDRQVNTTRVTAYLQVPGWHCDHADQGLNSVLCTLGDLHVPQTAALFSRCSPPLPRWRLRLPARLAASALNDRPPIAQSLLTKFKCCHFEVAAVAARIACSATTGTGVGSIRSCGACLLSEPDACRMCVRQQSHAEHVVPD